jgi:hypothetical protein
VAAADSKPIDSALLEPPLVDSRTLIVPQTVDPNPVAHAAPSCVRIGAGKKRVNAAGQKQLLAGSVDQRG